MYAKLLLVILISLLVALALLARRQQRLELAHEAALLRRQSTDAQVVLWDLESDIARVCRPERIRRSLEQPDAAWVTIGLESHQAAPPVRLAADR